MACSCGSAGPCQVSRRFGTEFLAQVQAIRVEGKPHRMPDGSVVLSERRKVATVTVLEDFSGRFVEGRVYEVATGMGGGDCGFPFHEGQRYLMDVSEQDGRFWTGICSQTRSEAAAGVQLRALRSGATRADVTGAVLKYNLGQADEDWSPKALAGIPVTLTGLDGQARKTTTAADGVDEFPVVPAGAYAIQVQLPPNLTLAWDGSPGVLVPEAHGDAGCVVDVIVSASGRIEGVISGAKGRLLPGYVEAFDRLPTPGQPGLPVAVAIVGEDGRFSLAYLEAGLYWIAFRPEQRTPGALWFYPGASSQEKAQSVPLDDGEVKTGLRWLLP